MFKKSSGKLAEDSLEWKTSGLRRRKDGTYCFDLTLTSASLLDKSERRRIRADLHEEFKSLGVVVLKHWAKGGKEGARAKNTVLVMKVFDNGEGTAKARLETKMKSFCSEEKTRTRYIPRFAALALFL